MVLSHCLLASCGRVSFDPAGAAPAQPGDIADDTPADARDIVDDAPADASDTGNMVGTPRVYASDANALYRIDPSTLEVTKVLDFVVPTSFEISDIAIDSSGNLFAAELSTYEIYKIDRTTGAGTRIHLDIGAIMDGLTFVPAGVLDPEHDVLVGTGADGNIYRIDTATGRGALLAATGVTGYPGTGDVVWTGNELLVTTNTEGDRFFHITRVDIKTGESMFMSDTDMINLYGLAWSDDQIFEFDNFGKIAVFDAGSGAKLRDRTSTYRWSGAALSVE